MKVFNRIEEIKEIDNTVIALGNFDGVHKGHQEIISRTVSSAKAAGFMSAVFTFSNHPKNLINSEKAIAVKNILYPEEKAEIIRSLGIDYLFNIPFDEKILNMHPISFIDDLLLQTLKMHQVYCGFNYRFGYRAEGTAEVLMREGMKKDFGIHILEPFKIDGNLVSSSLIRQLIEDGEVEQCAKYMGRLYGVGGEVVVGNKLGRTIGFPTSNIVIDETMVTPPNGVYITYCTYNGIRYPSITNVGNKPTIGEYEKNVETHIFNFDRELYGKDIKVEFIKKTRDEQKFASVEELSKKITDDCIMARAYHRQLRGNL